MTRPPRPVQSDAKSNTSAGPVKSTAEIEHVQSDAPADHIPDAGKMVAAPADPVVGDKFESLFEMANIAAGYPSDDEDLGFDAQVGRAFIAARKDLRIALGGADPVAGGREAVKQAIHDWVREDAPLNQKMTWTPALNTALENRILAALAKGSV